VINLDNNATTQPLDEVISGVAEHLRTDWHNPSSVHRAGQQARRAVDVARQSVANLLGVRPRTLTLTSGGTESIDLAIRGVLGARSGLRPPVIVTTAVEHAAIRSLCESLSRAESDGGASGVDIRTLPLDARGVVDVARASAMIQRDATIVSVQWANNETGAIQPVQEIARLCERAGVPFHVDATQWVGKMPTRIVQSVREQDELNALSIAVAGAMDEPEPPSALMCDLLTCAAHKFHAMKGAGVLYARNGLAIRPQLLGTQERERRGGTENVPGIVAMGIASEHAITWLASASERARLAALRDRLESAILGGAPGSIVNGPMGNAARLWNTTNIAFPNLEAEAILLALSERGVLASAGAACSSGSLDPSPVLLAMGVPPALAHGSVRFSLSRFSTADEVERAGEIVIECVARLRRSMS
jgi:cysteine desulfurase